MVEAQQRSGARPRCAGGADPRQAAKPQVRRLRPQRLAAAHDDSQPTLQLLAVAGVHPTGKQFCHRHGAAVAAFARYQVALYLRGTHRGVRQRPQGDAPAPRLRDEPSLPGRLRQPAPLIAHTRIRPDPAQGRLTATTLAECTLRPPPAPPARRVLQEPHHSRIYCGEMDVVARTALARRRTKRPKPSRATLTSRSCQQATELVVVERTTDRQARGAGRAQRHVLEQASRARRAGDLGRACDRGPGRSGSTSTPSRCGRPQTDSPPDHVDAQYLRSARRPLSFHALHRPVPDALSSLRRSCSASSRKQASAGTARRLKRILAELKTMLCSVQTWAGGAYTGVSNVNLVLIVGRSCISSCRPISFRTPLRIGTRGRRRSDRLGGRCC